MARYWVFSRSPRQSPGLMCRPPLCAVVFFKACDLTQFTGFDQASNSLGYRIMGMVIMAGSNYQTRFSMGGE
jgi:hypothetical protein